MIRAALLAAAAVPLLGAAPAPFVDYRVAIDPGSGIAVEMRFRGEPDGETRLKLPANTLGLNVSGATVAGSGEATLRHKPGGAIRVRYGFAGGGREFTALGDALFAEPVGWEALSARVRWNKLPKGWRVVSDLDHVAMGRPLTVADLRRSALVAGPAVQFAERTAPSGLIRAATQGEDAVSAAKLADVAGPAVTAMRSYLREPAGPFFLTRSGVTTRFLDLDDGFISPQVATRDSNLQREIVHAHVLGLLERRAGRPPPRPADWLTGGFSSLVADRVLLRAGLMSPDEWVGRWVGIDSGSGPNERGAILALKWDEEIRRKTGGKADLDDVLLRMRDHYLQFPPGQGPDLVTGLVSAVWVTAGLDVRADVARFGEGKAPIPLPEELFDGCLLARVTVSPGFDPGFNAEASFAAKRVTGVRRRGSAWNSGLRDGMRIESWTYQAGDMTRQIELAVRPANGKGRARRIAYWPYGDADVSKRRLQLDPDLAGERLTACGRRMAGL